MYDSLLDAYCVWERGHSFATNMAQTAEMHTRLMSQDVWTSHSGGLHFQLFMSTNPRLPALYDAISDKCYDAMLNIVVHNPHEIENHLNVIVYPSIRKWTISLHQMWKYLCDRRTKHFQP